jgi:putative ABC transport system ATP-binding protein
MASSGLQGVPAEPSAVRTTVPALRAEGLTRSYGRGLTAVRALRGVDLDVRPASLTLVRGRSGCGKTTLLNILGGLDRPDSGTVTLFGQDMARLGNRARVLLRRSDIGFVFQSFGLVPYLTAGENAGLPLRIAGSEAADREVRVRAALEAVGLTAFAEHRPAELSGGQQQRVAIARALVQRPRVLIADEPTGHLDSGTGVRILALLREVAEREGTAVVVSTHDRRMADFADRVVRLHDGRVIEGG